MLVRFESSETGEVLMFAETAKILLAAMGKETTARGTFTQPEMQPAAEALRAAVQRAEEGQAAPVDEPEPNGEAKAKGPVVALRQRAWPLIDMLERTSRSGVKAHIVWEAPQAF